MTSGTLPLADVLARAVRDRELLPRDALRVLKHEMRRRNTNRTARLPYRSAKAQAVIGDYVGRGVTVPKNQSDDALHADHVYEFGERDLNETTTLAALEVLASANRCGCHRP